MNTGLSKAEQKTEALEKAICKINEILRINMNSNNTHQQTLEEIKEITNTTINIYIHY